MNKRVVLAIILFAAAIVLTIVVDRADACPIYEETDTLNVYFEYTDTSYARPTPFDSVQVTLSKNSNQWVPMRTKDVPAENYKDTVWFLECDTVGAASGSEVAWRINAPIASITNSLGSGVYSGVIRAFAENGNVYTTEFCFQVRNLSTLAQIDSTIYTHLDTLINSVFYWGAIDGAQQLFTVTDGYTDSIHIVSGTDTIAVLKFHRTGSTIDSIEYELR